MAERTQGRTTDVYWAQLPAFEDPVSSTAMLGPELVARVKEYQDYLAERSISDTWRRAYDLYYRSLGRGGRLVRTGDQGEYWSINVNHLRNIVVHLHTMTTQQRPAFEPRATNSDYKSQGQTLLAKGLLDYYLREKRLERFLKTAVESALLFGEGYVRVNWDPNTGPDAKPDQEGIQPDRQKEGDVTYEAFTPIDVIRDPTRLNSEHRWVIVRTYTNRWDLVAKFCPDAEEPEPELPEHQEPAAQDGEATEGAEQAKASRAEELEAWEQRSKYLRKQKELRDQLLAIPDDDLDDEKNRLVMTSNYTKDDIAHYFFYHKKTNALPEGRLVEFVSGDVVLFDGPLPFDDVPVYRMSPADLLGTPFGYGSVVDLMAIQEQTDNLYGTVVTNNNAFGVQNLLVPTGSNLTVTSLGGGMNKVEYAGNLEPKPLQLTASSPETYQLIGLLEHSMETISGINSVVRGNPEASLKSGAALALVQSMAIQYASSLQAAYAQLVEDVGTATINMLKRYADTKRVATIVGKANRPYMATFNKEDLSEVNRVTVDLGSPLMRTTAGRVQLAETLIQNKMLKTPEQYLTLINTGTMDPLTEGDQAELMLIRDENEALREDRPVSVVFTDNHVLHIKEHGCVLASSDARTEPNLVSRVGEHILKHIKELTEMDPVLAQLLGQPAVPTAQQAAPADAMNPQSPEQQRAAEVAAPNMPNMPNNALTGEQWTPETGGLQ